MSKNLEKLVSQDYAKSSLLSILGLESVDEWFYPYIKEKRDVVFIHWTIVLSLLMGTLVTLLHVRFSWVVTVLYFACYFRFLGTFIIMLHCTSHSPMYKKEYSFMNHYLTLTVGWFFGHSPFTYYTHHIKMHHVENNAEKDLSSTMHFQRDSFVDFLKYYLRFMVLGGAELVVYFFKKSQYKYALMSASGELAYHAVGLSYLYYNTTLGVILYLIPLTLTRFFMMSGNWTQHAFLDPKDPYNDYKSSITCIDTPYNFWAFNDGYHASHHLHPLRHWTVHPGHLLESEKIYHDNKAVVFRGLDYVQIWFMLMTKNYSKLADYFVCLGGDQMSKQEIMSFLQERVQKFEPKQE